MKSLLEHLNQFPPAMVRAVARTQHGRRALSFTEIAQRSGLPRRTVIRLSQATQWNRIKIETAERFAAGCGVNLFIRWRHVAYLRKARKVAMGPAQLQAMQRATRAARVLGRSTMTGAGRSPQSSRPPAPAPADAGGAA